MATVEVTLPRMLAGLVGGSRRFAVEASTVRGALTAVTERHPELAVHLFDESGSVRQHVSIFHNERAAIDDVALGAGDSIVILQAVSGG